MRRLLLCLGIALAWPGVSQVPSARADERQAERSYGALEDEAQSEYSRIRIRRRGNIRTMLFVRDSGHEIGESQMNLSARHQLLIPYTQMMIGSYLFKPEQKRALLVGVGGGSMVHFLRHYDPQLQLDAVEIDAAVLRLAEKHFDTRDSENVRLITADGFKFLQDTESTYDAIYLDAFLKPSGDTDGAGVPLELKTEEFYRHVQTKVAPDGVVVFNLNTHAKLADDVKTLQRVFPTLYVFRAAETNLVAFGVKDTTPVPTATLRKRAKDLDARWKPNFSFERMLGKQIKPSR